MTSPIAGETRRTLRDVDALADAGLVAAASRPSLEAVARRFAVAITPEMADLVDAADPEDPIARQFVPGPAELNLRPYELTDPIGDNAHSPVEGVVHRYPDRVLLKPVRVCAVYCRFCFRRESVGPGRAEALSAAALDRALDYVAGRPDIWEVILSGGDPLVMSPRRMAGLMRRLGRIEHVRVVRVHTRVPVVAPDRVTPEMVDALRASGRACFVVVHANHAREITAGARAALARLADAGLPLLSQSVLLAGVNDDAATLEALLRALVENRVKPYYLHQGDLAPGTAHFRTKLADGQALVRGLRGRVSGLCQPALMLDIPGGHGKSPVGPSFVQDDPEGLRIADWRGGSHPLDPDSAEPVLPGRRRPA